ncbi:hypothetical protein MPSEU_000158600 [Mayamaea pseudoterrestris]|nr:hypothetical protein MPSEU_000158600 [Mayamaea pseudoterrestris]
MSFNQHHSGATEVLPLSSASQMHYEQHQAKLSQIELKRLAADPTNALVDVPTLPNEVRDVLRKLGLPVRLFGENLANIRDRLRLELIKRQQQQQGGLVGSSSLSTATIKYEGEENVTKYTRASQALVDARIEIAKFSLQRARERLEREKSLRALARQDKKRKLQVNEENEASDAKLSDASSELFRMDQSCLKTYKTIRQIALQGSQYGDTRTLSSIACCQSNAFHSTPLVATASWTGTIKLWDASSAALQPLGRKSLCHEDRIMHLDMVATAAENVFLATTSLDKTAKLWKITKSDVVMDEAKDADKKQQHQEPAYSLSHQATFAGHAARLCKVAFHPLHKHAATTSFDYSWRLWDLETGQQLLLQDGHLRECYGIGMHSDGSLVATTDFSGVTHLWDLRTGKSIHHFMGHAKRVLQTQFHPVNGFQLATAGDDGTFKIWDLRQRKLAVNVPAHSNLITSLKFDETGEFLASSSFDGTVKLWSSRSWKMLNELHGHDGKVTGVGLLGTTVVTSGFDKTLKLWS